VTVAVDTNVLVHAHRSDSPKHAAAVAKLEELARGPRQVALSWTVIYQFLRVVTHPRVFDPPSTIEAAWRFCGDLFAFPNAVVLAETEHHAEVLDRLLHDVRPAGNLVHDAHIATTLIEHGVSEIVTDDSDFLRFPGIRVVSLS
jgi:hypothetical protein